MFAYLIGNLDWPSAAALVALFVGIGAVSIALIGTRNTKTEKDYELEFKHAEIEAARYMYQNETNRIVETKRLEQNLITSHRETN